MPAKERISRGTLGSLMRSALAVPGERRCGHKGYNGTQARKWGSMAGLYIRRDLTIWVKLGGEELW